MPFLRFHFSYNTDILSGRSDFDFVYEQMHKLASEKKKNAVSIFKETINSRKNIILKQNFDK